MFLLHVLDGRVLRHMWTSKGGRDPPSCIYLLFQRTPLPSGARFQEEKTTKTCITAPCNGSTSCTEEGLCLPPSDLLAGCKEHVLTNSEYCVGETNTYS